MLVRLYAGFIESKVIGIGTTADSQQDVGTRYFALTVRTVEACDHRVTAAFKVNAFGVQFDPDALLFQNLFHRSRYVRVFMLDQPRTLFDDRHFAAKAPVHLAEFQSDVAAADDD